MYPLFLGVHIPQTKVIFLYQVQGIAYFVQYKLSNCIFLKIENQKIW